MYWIALWPSHDDERAAWGWRCLQFTPRVAWLDEALVLEVEACERLWGGRRKLLRTLLETGEVLTPAPWAAGGTAMVALALLRLKSRGDAVPQDVPDGLPVDMLTAAQEHASLLERIGCRTWGQLRALPRAGLARRFGSALVRALDLAYGEAAERYPWIGLPETFDVKLELPALATSAPELMWTGQRLLAQLQVWLQARNRGVLVFELEWTLDLRRLNGRTLPPTQCLTVRTAQPTQDMAHLRRLVSEHLSRTSLAAPANHLRLRSLETVPWGGIATSLLPEDNKPGEKLHEFIERLSVRLGEQNVLVGQARSDHRPERMQVWVPARVRAADDAPTPTLPRKGREKAQGAPHPNPLPGGEREKDDVLPAERAVMPGLTRHPVTGLALPAMTESAQPAMTVDCDSLYPTWLLPEPIPLEMHGHTPHYGGPLRRLARLYRVETAWWEEGGPACRDYFIARSDEAGLVWIYRERPGAGGRSRWYLQGLYA